MKYSTCAFFCIDSTFTIHNQAPEYWDFVWEFRSLLVWTPGTNRVNIVSNLQVSSQLFPFLKYLTLRNWLRWWETVGFLRNYFWKEIWLGLFSILIELIFNSCRFCFPLKSRALLSSFPRFWDIFRDLNYWIFLNSHSLTLHYSFCLTFWFQWMWSEGEGDSACFQLNHLKGGCQYVEKVVFSRR